MVKDKKLKPPAQALSPQTSKELAEESFGVLCPEFLAKKVSIFKPRALLCSYEDDTVKEIMHSFKASSSGCAAILNKAGKLTGIFSERDYMLKICLDESLEEKPVKEFMTPNPVFITQDTTIAFALNLLSQGGFRHLPLVDTKHHPVAIISVKDLIELLLQAPAI